MPRFILHVGPHKTGSTYIQRRLDQNAVSFRTQGIYVPTHWREHEGSPSHNVLVRRVKDGCDPELVEEFGNLHASSYQYVAISSEAFMECSDDTLSKFRSVLTGMDFTIVYYVRRWSELLLSSWNESIVHGGTLSFPDYLLSHLSNPIACTAINADLQLRRLTRIFGRSAITIISYNSVIEQGGDIFRHFSRRLLGEPKLLIPSELRSNMSASPALSELRRILNYLDQEKQCPQSSRMTLLLERNSDIEISSILKYLDGFQSSILLRDSVDSILQTLKRNRADYGDCLMTPVSPATIYELKSISASYIKPEYMLAPSFAATVRDLRVRLLGG
jgi:hypothetical protein